MTKVRDSVRFHTNLDKLPEHGRKRAPRSPSKSSRITATQVDLRVWRTALKLSKGDRSRIEVISSSEVVVHNPKAK